MGGKPKFPYLVGSKWTAQRTTFGWRHFQVVNRKSEGSLVFAELVATCDPAVRFWLNAKILRDNSCWLAGWQSIGECSQVNHSTTTAPNATLPLESLAVRTLHQDQLGSESVTEP